MKRYIAVEKDTPDVPRVWGEGETDLIARYNCSIESIIKKLTVLLIMMKKTMMKKKKLRVVEDFSQCFSVLLF